MILVKASDEDLTTAEKILKTEVLPGCNERAGAEWAQRWDD